MQLLFPMYVLNFYTIIILYFNIAGGRTKDDIIQWINKKSGPAAKVLQSEEEFNLFIEGKNVAIVGYFENVESDAAKLFSELADSVDDHPFALVSDYSKFSSLEHKENFVLYKDVSSNIYYVIYYLIIIIYFGFNFSLTKRKFHSIKTSKLLKMARHLFLFIHCLL